MFSGVFTIFIRSLLESMEINFTQELSADDEMTTNSEIPGFS